MSCVTLAAGLFDLTGEVALVTGASSGLGARFGEVLAAHGAKVVLAARRVEQLDALQKKITDAGGDAIALRLDVSNRDEISGIFDKVEAHYGPVSILVNNAGVSGQKPALKMTDEDWRKIMDVNLDGVWFCAQQAAQRMSAAKTPGAIINIASILGFRVAQSLSAYAVTKAAVVQMTKALAVELARHEVRVNAIAPGYILTEINREFFDSPHAKAVINQIPQRRIGAPSDLDGTLLLLASRKAAGFMTGSTIVVDGGHMIGMG